jgi:hypothetical protein
MALESFGWAAVRATVFMSARVAVLALGDEGMRTVSGGSGNKFARLGYRFPDCFRHTICIFARQYELSLFPIREGDADDQTDR